MSSVPRHSSRVRPRYGRISLILCSFLVTTVAVLGGLGYLPVTPVGALATADTGVALDDTVGSISTDSRSADSAPAADSGQTPEASPQQGARPRPDQKSEDADANDDTTAGPAPGPTPPTEEADAQEDAAVPADSGEGYRVVFSQGEQRVWLIEEDETIARTYQVSGSIYENLQPGTYRVYSRSEDAVGIDDSGTMKYFVRFTQGWSGAAIGFHDIPVKDGEPLQTLDELGTPLSHGCIRQRRKDAKALWDFAPIDTKVVVTA